VRRRLAEEAAGADDDLVLPPEAAVASAGLDDGAKAHLTEVKRGLHWILDTLGGPPATEFALAADPQAPRAKSRKKK
jgi:hypothetical protein